MSKTIDFSYTGGLPLDQVTLDKMQQSYVEFYKSFIAFLGVPETGNYILSGVTVTGPAISAGWVYMDGDVIQFPALTGTTGLTTKFIKQTTAESLSFEDTSIRPIYINTAIVQDASGVALSTFTRVKSIPEIPTGIVIDPADLTTTPPEKTVLQRLVDLEMFAQSNFLIYLLKGTYPIGDAAEHEDFKTITFSSIGTTNYTVLGELISKGNYAYDNDITFAIREKTATSFKIILNDTGNPSQIQDLEFNYILVKN